MTEIEILRKIAVLVEQKIIEHMANFVHAESSQGQSFDMKGRDGEILDLLIALRGLETK